MIQMIHIFYATDSKYLVPTLVSAASAAHWASSPKLLNVHILDCGLSDEEWGRFAQMLSSLNVVHCTRHVISVDRFARYKRWNGSLGLYARLLIPELVPDLDWCVYCDGDTLFTADPLELLDYYDERYYLVGHRDSCCDHGGLQIDWFVRHGLEFDADSYVCSGFLLMNLRAFRQYDISGRCFRLIEKYPDIINPDQDSLNVACSGHILQLRNPWGMFSSDVSGVVRGCIHYAACRPWRLSYEPGIAMRDVTRLWFHYAKKFCGLRISECDSRASLFRYVVLWCLSLFFKVKKRF